MKHIGGRGRHYTARCQYREEGGGGEEGSVGLGNARGCVRGCVSGGRVWGCGSVGLGSVGLGSVRLGECGAWENVALGECGAEGVWG